MPDHTWRHRHVNVENKKRAQEGKKPFPKYKGKGWDQKSQDDGSWKPSDVDYEQMEKDLGKKGQLTWPKPKIHPNDVAPEDKYKWDGTGPHPSQGVAGDAFTVLDALSIQKNVLKGAGSLLIKNIGNKFKNKLRIKPDMYNDLGM